MNASTPFSRGGRTCHIRGAPRVPSSHPRRSARPRFELTGRTTERRGIALLLVLAWLVLMLSIVVGVAQAAATHRARRDVDGDSRIADAVHRAAGDAIRLFFEHDADRVVLPPDSEAPEVPAPEVPGVSVLHDQLQFGDAHAITVRVTAWDQCGMVPIHRLAPGSPFRAVVPAEALSTIDALRSTSVSPTFGLDTLMATSLEDARNLSIFPRHREGRPPRHLGEVDPRHESDEPLAGPRANARPAIGAIVATHNDGPWTININTASVALLEAALRHEGRGGIEAILQARSRGLAAQTSSLSLTATRPTGPPTEGRAIAFVTSSDSWAFRIDIATGGATMSWWEVHQRVRKFRNAGDQWRCVQRIRITEQ